MANYAVINVNTNEWEYRSTDLEKTKAHLHLLRKCGEPFVLVQIIVNEDDEIPNIPNIFDA